MTLMTLMTWFSIEPFTRARVERSIQINVINVINVIDVRKWPNH